MAHDVFISYSTGDLSEAEKVCAHLTDQGISCWIAPRDIRAGEDYGEAIVNAIEDCRVLVLIYSNAANASDHIRNEVNLAFDGRKTILPVRIEDVALSKGLRYRLSAAQWLNAFGGVGPEVLRRLTGDLRKHLGTAAENRVTNPPAESSSQPASKSAGPPAPTEKRRRAPKPDAEPKLRTRLHPVDGLTYVFIPPGRFMMGCSPGDSECDCLLYTSDAADE